MSKTWIRALVLLLLVGGILVVVRLAGSGAPPEVPPVAKAPPPPPPRSLKVEVRHGGKVQDLRADDVLAPGDALQLTVNDTTRPAITVVVGGGKEPAEVFTRLEAKTPTALSRSMVLEPGTKDPWIVVLYAQAPLTDAQAIDAATRVMKGLEGFSVAITPDKDRPVPGNEALGARAFVVHTAP